MGFSCSETPEVRRFNSNGPNNKVKQLTPDAHGTFMLWSQFVDYHRERECEAYDREVLVQLRRQQIASLEKELAEAKASANNERGPANWWAPMARGTLCQPYPNQALANAAALVMAHDKGIPLNKITLVPLWGPV